MKTTRKYKNYVVKLKKNFSYSYYGVYSLKKGMVLYDGPRIPHGYSDSNGLTKKGWVFVLGHGQNEIIPIEYLSVTEQKITENKIIRVGKVKIKGN